MYLRENETTYSPKKMSAYGLCRSILLGQLYDDELEEYIKQFLKRIERYILEIKANLPPEDYEVFDSFLRENIQWFIKICYDEGDRGSHKVGALTFLNKFNSQVNESRRREVNNQILHAIIRKKMGFLIQGKYGVFEDYKARYSFKDNLSDSFKKKQLTIQEHRERETTFSEFQKKYKGLVYAFAKKYYMVFNCEVDDLIQEFEIVLYRCMVGYSGKNFARFSTYLRRALKNRVKDMYDAKYRQKRLIEMNTLFYPDGEGESPIGDLVDQTVHASWEIVNREHGEEHDIGCQQLLHGFSSSCDLYMMPTGKDDYIEGSNTPPPSYW